jgi:hypothetical protein
LVLQKALSDVQDTISFTHKGKDASFNFFPPESYSEGSFPIITDSYFYYTRVNSGQSKYKSLDPVFRINLDTGKTERLLDPPGVRYDKNQNSVIKFNDKFGVYFKESHPNTEEWRKGNVTISEIILVPIKTIAP